MKQMRLSGIGASWLILAVAITAEAVCVAAIVAAERSAQRADDARISTFQKAGSAWKKVFVDVNSGVARPEIGERAGLGRRKRLAAPIVRPESVGAAEAELKPDEVIIGVEVRGIARAYRLAAFESTVGHLVNDLVGGVPVSVAYCDVSRCLRVFSDPHGSEPLDLTVAGLLVDEMVVRYDGKMYFHKSGKQVDHGDDSPPLPFTLVTPTVTTWKEWTAKHPDTTVFIGPRDDASTAGRQPSARPAP